MKLLISVVIFLGFSGVSLAEPGMCLTMDVKDLRNCGSLYNTSKTVCESRQGCDWVGQKSFGKGKFVVVTCMDVEKSEEVTYYADGISASAGDGQMLVFLDQSSGEISLDTKKCSFESR